MCKVIHAAWEQSCRDEKGKVRAYLARLKQQRNRVEREADCPRMPRKEGNPTERQEHRPKGKHQSLPMGCIAKSLSRKEFMNNKDAWDAVIKELDGLRKAGTWNEEYDHGKTFRRKR